MTSTGEVCRSCLASLGVAATLCSKRESALSLAAVAHCEPSLVGITAHPDYRSHFRYCAPEGSPFATGGYSIGPMQF